MRCSTSDPFGPLAALGRAGLVVVVAALFLGGCTVTSFLGRQFTNFTAYYNKFHNANAAFEKGVESLEERERAIDRTQYVSVFLEPGEQINESPFEKAIQKSADVLREHPDSKWVDDALLLIGKSYFYQQNYVGAAQKFREAVALDGEKTPEARFWLARTLVATERYEAAVEVIRTGIEGQGWGPWTARLHLVRGQLLAQQEQWEEATQALSQGLRGDLPDGVAARAAFLLGQTLETIGRPTPARAAYQEVRAYDPSYALDLAARLSDIELQGTHGDAARALDRLRDLETDEKNYEQRGEMAVVRARIYRAQGQEERARETLRDMLYGEEPPSGASRGRLHYDLARLYRDAFKDFSQAAAHFDTASTDLGTASGAERAPRRMPAAPVDAGTQADRYRDLAERARTVARLDSLLRLGRMSDEAFRAYVADLRRQRRAQREAQDEEDRSRRLQGGGQRLAEQRRGAAPAADTRQSDAGFLFHKDPARVQRGRRRFEQTWGDRPLVDNWRRRVAIRSTETAEADQDGSASNQEVVSSRRDGPGGVAEQASAGEAVLDLAAVPRDSASLAKMEARRTVSRYKLANSLFLAASRPDSAATWYRRILQESGDHPVAKRALYALAEAYRAQGDSTAAQQTYQRLVDRYPGTVLSARARQRLDLPERTSADNRRAQADSAYARVYRRWQEGERGTLVGSFLRVAARYPDTRTAPRALLAGGVVYWRQIQHDASGAQRRAVQRFLQRLSAPDSARVDSARVDSVRPDSAQVDSLNEPRERRAVRAASGGPSASGGEGGASRSGQTDTLRTARTRSSNDGRPATPDTSARLSPDSTLAVPPTDTTRRDSIPRREPDVYAPLEALMTHLTERYPEAPQVAQARSILSLIEERRAQTRVRLADTTAADTTAADTAVTDTAARAEATFQTEGAQRTDSSAAAARAEAGRKESPSVSTSSRDTLAQTEEASGGGSTTLPAPPGDRGTENQRDKATAQSIDPEEGGWTLLVQTFSNSRKASVRVVEVGRQLGDRWPVKLLKEETDEATKYRLVAGQFRSERAAERARKRVGTQLARQPEVWALSNMQGRP